MLYSIVLSVLSSSTIFTDVSHLRQEDSFNSLFKVTPLYSVSRVRKVVNNCGWVTIQHVWNYYSKTLPRCIIIM